MARKITEEVRGRIISLLKQKVSYRMIIKILKDEKISFSRGTIGNINESIKTNGRNLSKSKKIRQKGHRRLKLNSSQVNQLKLYTYKENPPTISYLARKFEVCRKTIRRYINIKFDSKRVSKQNVHQLSESVIKKRFERSWGLYEFIRINSNKIITTDEKLFHLSELNQTSKFYYKKRDDKSPPKKFIRKPNFSKSIMVWAGISKMGKTELKFVKPGVKINSEYYINDILKPNLELDFKKLYPKNDFILHQDSAPSHVSKMTLKFLKDNKVKYIPPEKWTPCSPDNAPLDYFVWGYMLKELAKRKAKNIEGLKRHLKDIWKNIPQNIIDKALDQWPKRCRYIYMNKGNQIEHLIHKK